MIKTGVIGFGRAGRARLKALSSLGVPIKSIASSRGPHLLDELGLNISQLSTVPQWTRDWRELIADPEIDLILICSETEHHDQQARAALNAGKHVCVEFPLTETAKQAESLWALAQQRKVCLHVEVIGTLTAQHVWIQQKTREGRVRSWNSQCTGRLYRWVDQAAQNGLIPLLAFGRLYQAVDLFGPLTLKSTTIETTMTHEPERIESYCLEAHLENTQGVKVQMREERGMTLSRTSTTKVFDHLEHELDPIFPGHEVPDKPLFERDLMHLLSLIGAHPTPHLPGYATRDKIIQTHQLCDQITTHLNSIHHDLS